MKKATAVLLALITTVIMCAAFTAYAAEIVKDSIRAYLTTDKTEYAAGEPITVTLTVTNTNDFAVTGVSLECFAPAGYKLTPASEAVMELLSLNEKESVTLTAMYVPEILSDTETSVPNRESVKNDTSVPDTRVSDSENVGAQVTTGSGKEENGTNTGSPGVSPSSPQTGHIGHTVMYAAVMLAAGTGIIVILFLGRKKRRALLSVMLCAAVIGTSAFMMPSSAMVSDAAKKSLEISTAVRTEDKNTTISAKVSYKLTKSDTPSPTPVPDPDPIPDPEPVKSSLVLIGGGIFRMGSPANEPERSSDEVQHSVTVGSFYMSKTEVSQRDYQKIMGVNPSSVKGDDLPVTDITWYDAIMYCNKLSEAEGLPPCYNISGTTVTWDRSADGYRLPTEAEWEYAARADTETPFNFGDYVHNSDANCYNAYGYNNDASGNWVNGSDAYLRRTVVVNQYQPNAYGLYNMHGNAAEWVWDWYGEYSSDTNADPTGPEGGNAKIVRGGGWNDHPKHIRSAYRGAQPADVGLYSIGFRPVRNAQSATGEIRSVYSASTVQKTGKTLIVYFSQTGNTEGLAELIHEMSGADIFRLERKIPYSSSSNGPVLYGEALDELRAEAVPELKEYPDIDEYDTILLGYCNWWSSIPACVRTFLSKNDLSGKTVVPFCSMGGGQFGQTISAIAKLAPSSVIREGLMVSYSSYDRDEIGAWLERSLPRDPGPNPTPTPEPETARVLVAYFSATNNTEGIANHVKSALGDSADIYEILAEIPYTAADLNYSTDCRANREQNDESARPAISTSVKSMEQYDVVFLGYPIWWGEAPKIISTFLESYDFSGKTVVPFCTSGSSGIGSSATHLHSLTPGASWLEGRRFGAGTAGNTVAEWVNGLGLNFAEKPE